MANLLIIYSLASYSGLFGTIIDATQSSLAAPICIMGRIISLTSYSSIAR